MSVYFGISSKTGEIVAGDMLIELVIAGGKKKESIVILDYADMELHPVEACIKIPFHLEGLL